jgi:hypothetical protein
MMKKIGNLEFKDYAAEKPVSLTAAGEFLTASEVVAQPSLSLTSLVALDTDLQVKLAVERYALEPDFALGIIGAGLVTRDEAIDHIKRQDEFGQLALQVEMGYLNNLLGTLSTATIASAPEIPSPPWKEVPWKVWPPWRRRKPCIWLRLPTRALFCEDTTDPVTTPFANYRIANVHPEFQARGFSVVVLQGTDDVRVNFVPRAKHGLTVYVGGIGHGNYNRYTGHWGNRILEVGVYDPAEVKDKAIHFLSCRTAAQLGPDTVTQGAKGYAGYTENFTFVWDDTTTPVDEFLLFAASDSTFDLMMANGATAQDAYDATILAFDAAISQVPNTVAASWLMYDRDHLELHGVPATQIRPYRTVKICFPLVSLELEDALVEAGVLQD